MYILIRVEHNLQIRAEIIKVKDGVVFYKHNLDDHDEKWKSVLARNVKMFQIKDHRSEHPGTY